MIILFIVINHISKYSDKKLEMLNNTNDDINHS